MVNFIIKLQPLQQFYLVPIYGSVITGSTSDGSIVINWTKYITSRYISRHRSTGTAAV